MDQGHPSPGPSRGSGSTAWALPQLQPCVLSRITTNNLLSCPAVTSGFDTKGKRLKNAFKAAEENLTAALPQVNENLSTEETKQQSSRAQETTSPPPGPLLGSSLFKSSVSQWKSQKGSVP